LSCYIVGCGAALPDRVVTNSELAPLLGVTPDWIEVNSGIRERRWVAAHQATSDIAAEAVAAALSDAGIGAGAIDYLLGSTLSPDYQVPGVAPLVLRKLNGHSAIPAADLRSGCAAILYCLQLGRALIESGSAKTVVCFGAEAQSKGLDLSPESAEISMLFGDGAGAIVLSSEPAGATPREILRVDDILIETDGGFAEELAVRAPGTANGARWIDPEQVRAGLHLPLMNGRTVILQAVRRLSEAAYAIAERNDIKPSDIDLVIPHQANLNLLKALSKRLGVPDDRIVINVDRFGNTSGASAFISLWQAHREHRLRDGDRVLLAAFGAGFTWGVALCRVVTARAFQL
ncbi:MAG TPA: ketoacyl-ACP synthase III, partial [Blastocatellia bacterium]|nr:ketoacyl-ACP synthase III [Blastocatellia bacterium]